MGVLDKIKNALFEVEYVEVEEPPKKEKKPKKVREEKENKPIAKKIVLPGRRREKVEELEEEELRDEDFEIEPKEEIEEEKHEEFKVLDDSDFEMDDDEYIPGEPEILQVMDPEEENNAIKEEIQEEKLPPVEEEPVYYSAPEREERYDDYTSYEPKAKVSKPYGMDDSYNVPVHEYGRYEKYEEKTYFRPSPIISPIYGILDKNYKKEDVREKQDIRLTSYSRSSVNVDDIREKAYGPKHEEKEDVETTFEVEEENDNLMVDLSDRAKPEVKEVTVGDALEYFEDLGLEYNVDYVDRSKEEKENQPKVEEQSQIKENDISEQKEEVKEETQDIESDVDDDNDNLFDLIDSMYQENK